MRESCVRFCELTVVRSVVTKAGILHTQGGNFCLVSWSAFLSANLLMLVSSRLTTFFPSNRYCPLNRQAKFNQAKKMAENCSKKAGQPPNDPSNKQHWSLTISTVTSNALEVASNGRSLWGCFLFNFNSCQLVSRRAFSSIREFSLFCSQSPFIIVLSLGFRMVIFFIDSWLSSHRFVDAIFRLLFSNLLRSYYVRTSLPFYRLDLNPID